MRFAKVMMFKKNIRFMWCPTLDDMDHGETTEIPQAVEQSAWRELCAQELGDSGHGVGI